MLTIDERVELEVIESGIDPESDEGARFFQERLEEILERERKHAFSQPPRPVERVGAIRI